MTVTLLTVASAFLMGKAAIIVEAFVCYLTRSFIKQPGKGRKTGPIKKKNGKMNNTTDNTFGSI